MLYSPTRELCDNVGASGGGIVGGTDDGATAAAGVGDEGRTRRNSGREAS